MASEHPDTQDPPDSVMTPGPDLVVIASCTQRKTVPAPPDLRLRRYRGTQDRIGRWRAALERSDATSLPAIDLYGGDFFSVVRDILAVAEQRGTATALFIASAGYGLVSAHADLKPYSATFAGGPDCVYAGSSKRDSLRQQLRDWWLALGRWRGPHGYRGPRTVEQIARSWPNASILVVASPTYVRAMMEDLERAASALRSKAALAIVSSVVGFPRELDAHLVPSVGALRTALGGTMGSLHARTARHLLGHADMPLDAPHLKRTYTRMAARVRPRALPARESRSDAQVREFIRSTVKALGPLSCTKMLRFHRDSGFQCEQRRFRSLFEEVVVR